MDQTTLYIGLLGIVVLVGVLFSKSPVPTALVLLITGMLISLFPDAPRIKLDPNLVLHVFLPILIFGASAELSVRDIKTHFRPIALLSIGHVFFITFFVAVIIHTLIPHFSWPMAFLLGAVISPPDDVAIAAVLEKTHMPRRILTVLRGEGMLNDVTALILFRFSLAAIATHAFSMSQAVSTFLTVIVGETLYGIALGYVLGKFRLKIRDPILQIMFSVLTPFLAYLPATRMGGCGVLATVVTGLVIGHKYLEHFPSEARLVGQSVWSTLGFTIQSILFLLVGLDLRSIVDRISSIPLQNLLLYSIVTVLAVILGRFIWVYTTTYLPQLLFPRSYKKKPYSHWQYPFVISWAGMRGGLSLAAALAVPALPSTPEGINPTDLLIFLVFCVIAVTLLLQGLTLPWLLDIIGIRMHGRHEQHHDHLSELLARLKINKTVLRWLSQLRSQIQSNPELLEEVKFHIDDYRIRKTKILEKIKKHAHTEVPDQKIEKPEGSVIVSHIIEIEMKELFKLWHKDEINHSVRNKLLQQLDHRAKDVVE